jgi:gliding motility-associated-like protein
MMKRLLMLFPVMLAYASHAQVNITSNQTAAVLSQKLAGAGITIMNPLLNCPSGANGVFDVVSSNLGLDSGIILTTGRAMTVGGNSGANNAQFVGVNNNASLNNGWAGDAQLNTLANSNTHDACILEFDLVPKGDTIKFDYVFGSEEYWKSTCGTYNDAFAFFISGPGITGQENMALVPGTTIPVTVNSINSGVPGTQGSMANCTAMGVGSPFTTYYIDNSAGTTISYYGFTTVLTAMHSVQACSTYHLKLTIADAGNFLYDSGVFLKAGSLKTSSFSMTAHSGTTSADTMVYKGCNPGKFVFKRSELRNTPQTLKFQIAGTAVNGVDYSFIADSVIIPANDTLATLMINGLPTPPNGETILKLYLYSPYSCNGSEIIDSAYLKIADQPQASIITPDTTVCLGTTFQILVNGANNMQYAWTPSNGLSASNVKEPGATPPSNIIYHMFASLANTGCPPQEDSISITVMQPPVVDAGADQTVCPGTDVQLTAFASPANPGYTYQWSGPNGFNNTASSATVNNVNANNGGLYTITVGIPGCTSATDDVLITVTPAIEVNAGDDKALCPGDTIQLFAMVTPGGQYNYIWSGPNGFSASQSSAAINNVTVSSTGYYVVTASYQNCTPVSDTVYVRVNPTPDKPVLAAQYPLVYCKNAVAEPLHVFGHGLMWYTGDSEDGYLEAPIPSTANIGVLQFFVSQTVLGCISPKQLIEVVVEQCCDDNVFIPTAFSPNGDGRNDVFKMMESPFHQLVFLNVYNRWGELVFKGNTTNPFWDGTYKGKLVEVGNYFFQLSAVCKDGTAIDRKGDVMVVR